MLSARPVQELCLSPTRCGLECFEASWRSRWKTSPWILKIIRDGKGDDISCDRDGKTKRLVRSACQLYMESREEMAWLEKKF